jgi:pimeloyl-ACP methyl ester carboxylesterase
MAGISTFRSVDARADFCQLYDAAVIGSPVPITESDVETSWGRTHVLAAGDTSNPPLIAVHGKSFNATSWLPLLPVLSANYRVTMIDVVGDLTKSIAGKPITKASHIVAWLDETLHSLEIDRAALVGMSFGAWMAANYAMAFPARVDRLALICPVGLVSGQHLRWILRAYGSTSVRPTVIGLEAFLDTMATPAGRQRLRQDPWRLVREQFINGTLAFKPALISVRPTRCNLRPLASAQFPILAIVGKQESLHDGPQMATRLRQQLPAARIEVIDDANHIIPVDQPEIVEQLLADFLQPSA